MLNLPKEIEDHPLMSAIAAIAGIVILIFVYSHRSSASGSTTSTATTTSTLPQTLQTINNYQYPTQTIPPQPVSNPAGIPKIGNPIPNPQLPSPIVPYGQLPRNISTVPGSKITYNGSQYTVGSGNSGHIWAVPGWMSFSQYQSTPIFPNGGKVLFYSTNKNDYH